MPIYVVWMHGVFGAQDGRPAYLHRESSVLRNTPPPDLLAVGTATGALVGAGASPAGAPSLLPWALQLLADVPTLAVPMNANAHTNHPAHGTHGDDLRGGARVDEEAMGLRRRRRRRQRKVSSCCSFCAAGRVAAR